MGTSDAFAAGFLHDIIHAQRASESAEFFNDTRVAFPTFCAHFGEGLLKWFSIPWHPETKNMHLSVIRTG